MKDEQNHREEMGDGCLYSRASRRQGRMQEVQDGAQDGGPIVMVRSDSAEGDTEVTWDRYINKSSAGQGKLGMQRQ